MCTKLYPGDKAAGRDTKHLPPPNAKVKNEWSYTSTTLSVFMVWTGETDTFLTPYFN